MGVLLLHGYSGVPSEMRPLATHLASAGYSVAAPLLKGHGGVPADLYQVTWQDWAGSAHNELTRLREHCPTVVVAGLSMGGLLALHLAARVPVAGVIAMAPALQVYGAAQLRLAGLLKRVHPWFSPFERADFSNPRVQAHVRAWVPDADFGNPDVIARIKRESRLPVGSLYELVLLQRQIRRDLPRVTAPLLLLYGQRDTTVTPASIDEVAAGVRSAEVTRHVFARSGHILPNDVEAPQVAAFVSDWLARHT